MERKYYLRGLGIGIAVTAIIMGIALAGDKTMTDDEIIARARELGMVENTVLTNSDDKTDKEENADAHDKTDDTGDNVQGAPESTASDDVTAVENGAVEEETDGDIAVPADTTDLTGDEQAAAETGEKPGESDAEQAEPGTPDGAVEAGTDNEAPRRQRTGRRITATGTLQPQQSRRSRLITEMVPIPWRGNWRMSVWLCRRILLTASCVRMDMINGSGRVRF